MDNAYSHAPLDLSGAYFRLVELQPCGPADLIKCRLTTHALPPDCPEYIALSYMWDHVSPQDEIELNGVRFPVGHSLWTFLNQMRLDKKFGTYWIDALCIDQSNVQERNHQVQVMRCIYTGAQSVLIWLGDAEKGSLKVEAIRHMTDKDNPRVAWPADYLIRNARRASLEALCEDPYWDRMWIVQEIVLARKAMISCGAWQVDFEVFKSNVTKVFGISGTAASFLCKFQEARTLEPLAVALRYCAKRKATDIRDRVYALLGVVEKRALTIPVDYTLPPEQLWEVVFSYFCQTMNRGLSTQAIETLGNTLADVLEVKTSKERTWSCIVSHFITRAPPTGSAEIRSKFL